MTAAEHLHVRAVGGSMEIVAELERRRAEAFTLEVKSLARRFGLEVQVERAGDATPHSLT